MTRYLAGVFTGQLFRLQRHALLEFESILVPDEIIRSPDQCLASVIEKAERYLADLGHSEIGVKGTNYPDEEWVFRVVRCRDPSNSLRCFKRAVRDAPNPPGRIGRM